jgi:hypothetical protein
MTRNWHTNLTSRVSWDMRLLWLSYHSHDRELARLFCTIVHHFTKSDDDCIMKTKSAFSEALTQGHWPGLRFSSLTGKWLELSLLGGMNSSDIRSGKTARQKNSQCISFDSTLRSWYMLPWMRWAKCKLSDIIVPRELKSSLHFHNAHSLQVIWRLYHLSFTLLQVATEPERKIFSTRKPASLSNHQ